MGLLGVVQGLAVIELRVLCMPVGAHKAIHIHQVGAGPHVCNVDLVTLFINCFIVDRVDTHIDIHAPKRWLDLPRWNPKYMTKIISIKTLSLIFQSWGTRLILILISRLIESERCIVRKMKNYLISGFLKSCFMTKFK